MQHQLARERKRRRALEAQIDQLRGSLGEEKADKDLTEALIRNHETACGVQCGPDDYGESGTEILKWKRAIARKELFQTCDDPSMIGRGVKITNGNYDQAVAFKAGAAARNLANDNRKEAQQTFKFC
eukprot:gnl/MRDRNA2_/MRDRNA2_96485_c0_seq1.p1 gnl/MRDRNA2_/MRDRNA2_96485_c0~~gnl/MRDRNA2_/MRDRNA2_96485_c0_seq1.p1  ORF type:complete len:127 (+),score=28.33 gnl/MRDRNA2_/MRDRNA2_96485_c0_seq1:318-698(+)